MTPDKLQTADGNRVKASEDEFDQMVSVFIEEAPTLVSFVRRRVTSNVTWTHERQRMLTLFIYRFRNPHAGLVNWVTKWMSRRLGAIIAEVTEEASSAHSAARTREYD